MRRVLAFFTVAVGVTSLSASQSSGTGSRGLLISTSELAAALTHPDLVLLHVVGETLAIPIVV